MALLQGRGPSCQCPAMEFPAEWRDRPRSQSELIEPSIFWCPNVTYASSHRTNGRTSCLSHLSPERNRVQVDEWMTRNWSTPNRDRSINADMDGLRWKIPLKWFKMHDLGVLIATILCQRPKFCSAEPSFSARDGVGSPAPHHLPPSLARWSTSHPKRRWCRCWDDGRPEQ